MRKLFCIMIVFVLAATFAGCSKSEKSGITFSLFPPRGVEATQPATEPTTLPTMPTAPETEPMTPMTEPTEPPTEPTEPSTEPTEPPAEPSRELPVAYVDVLEDYKNIVAWRLSDNFEAEYNSGVRIPLQSALKDVGADEVLSYRWHCMLVEMRYKAELTEVDFGYELTDLNGDGTEELLWTGSDDIVLAIFSIYDEEVRLLDAYWSRYSCRITEDGKVLTVGSSGAANTTYEVKILDADGKELLTEKMFGTDGWDEETNVTFCVEWIDGQKVRISEDRLAQLQKEFFDMP